MVVDLLVQNCKIVRASGITEADIAIDEGKIVSIGGSPPPADRVVNANGKHVIPGLIDPHTHFNNGPELPDLVAGENRAFETETRAAAVGGITTVMTLLYYDGAPLYGKVVNTTKAEVEKRAYVDMAFHIRMMGEPQIEDIPICAKEHGLSSFKFNMAYTGKEAASIGLKGAQPLDDGMFFSGLERVRDAGYPAVAMIHAENIHVIHRLIDKISKTGRQDLSAWYEARPPYVEEEAVNRSIFLAKITGAPLYIVHNTIAGGVNSIARAKAEGVNVYAETCPQYLVLNHKDSRMDSRLLKVNPAIKTQEDNERLWWGMRNRVIDTVGSDHCSHTIKSKQRGDLWTANPGMPGIGTMLPLLLSEGVNKNRISLEDLVRVTSYNTSRIFGLFPKKGDIQVGCDADLVIADLDKTMKVDTEKLKSHSDYSPYDGWSLKGWPVTTIVRGAVVVEDGNVVGKSGYGRYVARPSTGKAAGVRV